MERAFEGTRKAIAVEKGWVFLKSTKSFFSIFHNYLLTHRNDAFVAKTKADLANSLGPIILSGFCSQRYRHQLFL